MNLQHYIIKLFHTTVCHYSWWQWRH